jgi:hypothetical protein
LGQQLAEQRTAQTNTTTAPIASSGARWVEEPPADQVARIAEDHAADAVGMVDFREGS